MFKAVLYVS